MARRFLAVLSLFAIMALSLMSEAPVVHNAQAQSTIFCIPTSGSVTQRFVSSSSHSGIDISSTSGFVKGAPIYAPYKGRVIYVGGDGTGKYSQEPYEPEPHIVAIDHGWIAEKGRRVLTHYGHMGTKREIGKEPYESYIAVKLNDWVERGTLIGYQGAAGNVSGTHLHWEVREKTTDTAFTGAFDGTPVNPETYTGSLLSSVKETCTGSQPPTFAGQFVSQSYQGTMMAGSTQTVQVQVKNTGTATWDNNTKIAPVPRDQASPFYDPATWQSNARIMSAGSVAPGQTKVFQFGIRAPTTPGQYQLRFGFLQEGVTWFPEPGDGAIWFQINVTYAVGDGSGRAQMFRDAYSRKGGTPSLGYPTNSAHWWGDGGERTVVVQEFSGGSVGDAAIIHDEKRDTPSNSLPAYVVQGGIWQKYRELGGWQSWLGPPTSDEFENAGGQPQSNFRNGYIIWRSPVEVQAWPSAVTGQWRAEYRNGSESNLNSYPTWVQNVSSINQNWGTSAPGGGKWGVWADHFSVRWTGRFSFEAGDYAFISNTDDGIRVWVDGNLVIDHWQRQAATEYRVSRTMTAGEHDIKVEYFEYDGPALAQFRWERINRVPTTPSNLRIGTTSETSVTFHWQDNATNEDGFNIYKWDGVASEWRLLTKVGTNTTQYTDTNLSCGSAYFYDVAAFNTSGESEWPNHIEARTLPCKPTDIRIGNTTADTVEIKWQASGAVDGFKIYQHSEGRAGDTFMELIGDIGPNARSFVATGIKCGSLYIYEIYTYWGDKRSSFGDNWVSYETGACTPAAPSNLRVSATSRDQISLVWQDNASDEDGFNVYRWDGVAGDWKLRKAVAANTTTFTDTGLQCSTTYYYEVKAHNSEGESASSGWIEVTTSTCTPSDPPPEQPSPPPPEQPNPPKPEYKVFIPFTLR